MEVVGQVQHAEVTESELPECAIGRPDIRALMHRAAAAVEHNSRIFRQTLYGRMQFRNAFGFRSRAGELGTGNMFLAVENGKRDAEDMQMLIIGL